MTPQRFATGAAALCGTVVLAGWVVSGLAGFGSPGFETTDAAPIEDRSTTSVIVKAEPVEDAPRSIALANPDLANTDVATAAVPATEAAASGEPEAIVEAALPEPAQTPSPEPPPEEAATTSTSDPMLNDSKLAVNSTEIFDECLEAEICINRYLWAVYQRTPKLDTIKVRERRKVTVKKKGKTLSVVKSVTKLVDEDFTWKDPKAAEKAGMPMMDYVIGGMDRNFKLKLFHALCAADEAGLSPGITSAFRDDYRQGIATGLKAATDRSYHGGSFRGGYGHGLAADLVSVKGETRAQRWVSSENFWKWIDAHGKEFGIGRPYLDRDPPHVAPIDGKEYAGHQRGTKSQHAKSNVKKRNHLAVRDDHTLAKRAKTARSSKVRTI